MWESGFRQGTLQRPQPGLPSPSPPIPLSPRRQVRRWRMPQCHLPLRVSATSSFGVLPFSHFGSSVVKKFVIIRSEFPAAHLTCTMAAKGITVSALRWPRPCVSSLSYRARLPAARPALGRGSCRSSRGGEGGLAVVACRSQRQLLLAQECYPFSAPRGAGVPVPPNWEEAGVQRFPLTLAKG